jgi:CheY-like chemotaxis protein
MTSIGETAILVVDDDRDSLDALEYLISNEGAIVKKAKNAREALAGCCKTQGNGMSARLRQALGVYAA